MVEHKCLQKTGTCCGGKCHDHSDKKVKVMFCPKCKSFNVKYTFGFGNLFGVLPKQKCGDCSYSAPFFPILETSSKSLHKKSSKTKKGGRKKR